MLSPAQSDAVRAWVIAALGVDDYGQPLNVLSPALPLVPSGSVIWDHQDGPRPSDGPRVVLSIVGSDEAAPTEDIDRTVEVDGEEVLETRYRDFLNVTLNIKCYSRRNPAAPSFSQDADQIVRRIWSRVYSRAFTVGLDAAGVGVNRRGSIQPLPRLMRGVQWETGAGFDLRVHITPMVYERTPWVETVSGESTITPAPPENPEPFEFDLTP